MFTTISTQQKTLDRAKANGGAAMVYPVNENEFSVLSSNKSDFHTVRTVGNRWICNCLAGQRETCCWHLGALWLWKLAQAVKAAVTTAPAPASTPIPVKRSTASAYDRHGLTAKQELWG